MKEPIQNSNKLKYNCIELLTIESFSARAMFGFGPISTQRQSFLGAKLTLMMSTPKTIRDLDLDLFVKRIKKSPRLPDTGQHFRYRKL